MAQTTNDRIPPLSHLEQMDAVNVARYILGMEGGKNRYEGIGDGDVIDAIFDRWGTDVESFTEIVSALLSLTPVIASPLTDQKCHAFLKPHDDGEAMIVMIKRTCKE